MELPLLFIQPLYLRLGIVAVSAPFLLFIYLFIVGACIIGYCQNLLDYLYVLIADKASVFSIYKYITLVVDTRVENLIMSCIQIFFSVLFNRVILVSWYMCLLRKVVSRKSLLYTEVQSLNSLLQILIRAALGLGLDTLNPLGATKGPRGSTVILLYKLFHLP